MFAQPTLVVNKDVDVFQVIGLMKTYTVCVRERFGGCLQGLQSRQQTFL